MRRQRRQDDALERMLGQRRQNQQDDTVRRTVRFDDVETIITEQRRRFITLSLPRNMVSCRASLTITGFLVSMTLAMMLSDSWWTLGGRSCCCTLRATVT